MSAYRKRLLAAALAARTSPAARRAHQTCPGIRNAWARRHVSSEAGLPGRASVAQSHWWPRWTEPPRLA